MLTDDIPNGDDGSSQPRLDPVYASSLREAKWILFAWTVGFIWVIGVCVGFGYDSERPQQQIETRLGMPRWVFWGVLVPWVLTTLFTVWFALTRMSDHPLDGDPPPEPSDD